LVATSTREELLRSLESLAVHTDTYAEAAARRGVSGMTLRRMIERGEVQVFKLGRAVRVFRDE
jgi:excisionase family DNA binding protein